MNKSLRLGIGVIFSIVCISSPVTAQSNRYLDSDGDSLWDFWEMKYFGDLGQNWNDDSDSDGRNALLEMLADTNPTNTSSNFELSLTTSALQFGPVMGQRRYTIESSTQLTDPDSWVAITNVTVNSYADFRELSTGMNGDSGFYRVVMSDNSEAKPIPEHSESPLLKGVPIIHDQTFLIPENAVANDTVGDLNLMWVSPDQNLSFSLVNDDGGRFELERITNVTCISNHRLGYRIRLSVNLPSFDFDVQTEHEVIVRAEDPAAGTECDATITIRLSREETTFFIDPAAPDGGDGSRTTPFNSWIDDVSGGHDSWQGGVGIIEPGHTYLQKRGTVYEHNTTDDYMGLATEVSGTEEQHIALGAYGSGERPVFESINIDTANNLVGGGFGIRFLEEGMSHYDLYSLAFRKQSVGISTHRFGFDDLTMTDLHFDNCYGVGIYFWTTERDSERYFCQNDVDNRSAIMRDSYSERAGFVPDGSTDPMPNDNYGFKFAGALRADVYYTVVRNNENHGFSNAAANSLFQFCQVYSNRYGIKAHGNDMGIDHCLIEDNSEIGILHGSYYNSYDLYTHRMWLKNSCLRNNGSGLIIQEDAKDGVIENNRFENNGTRAIYIHYTNPYDYVYGPPGNFVFQNNVFSNNARSFIIGDSGEPLVYDITIQRNQFHDNTSTPIDVNEVSNLEIYHNVFFENAGSTDIQIDSFANDLIIRNNLYDSNINLPGTGSPVVDHNAASDPALFVDAANRDFHLAEESAAIDAGTYIGENYWRTAPDLGAFEAPPITLTQ